MALVSIAEAARLTGKSTKTLYRLASQGRLSMSHDESGVKNVDTAELARVFGQLKRPGETPGETDMESRLRQLEKENADLRQVAAVLAAEKAGVEALSAQRETQIQDMRQAMRLLEGPAKRRWWQFGR